MLPVISVGISAVVIVLIFGTMFLLRLWISQAVMRLFNQRSSQDERVPLTGTARMTVGNLPADINLIAQVGAKKAPMESLNGKIMTPTIGVRVISLVLTAALLYMMFAVPGEFMPDDIFLTFPLTGLLIYAQVHTHMSYMRYDSEGVEAMTWSFARKQAKWKDIISIRDNGHYLYVFHLGDGTKLQVLKFMKGMPEFLTYAHERMRDYD